jgi:hypothetical protein
MKQNAAVHRYFSIKFKKIDKKSDHRLPAMSGELADLMWPGSKRKWKTGSFQAIFSRPALQKTNLYFSVQSIASFA